MILKHYMPRVFSTNPTFYKLYYHLFRKHRGLVPNYFEDTTNIYLDGFPRSGNTYLVFLVKTVFPNLHSASHLHKIAPIKIAQKKNIPSFILYRDPNESIPSNYLKFFSAKKQELPNEIQVEHLKYLCDSYMSYYQFVYRMRDDLNLIHFKELIDKPGDVLYDLGFLMGINCEINDIEYKISQNKDNFRGSTTKYGSSKPSRIKEIEKAKIKDELNHIKSMDDCNNVYENLKTCYYNMKKSIHH